MAYENAPGTGALFPNDRKTSDNQPDRTGHIIAHRDIKAGEKLRLAAWVKEGKKGKFLSLRMSDAPRGDAGKRTGGGETPPAKSDLDDDIPFILWGDWHEQDVL